MVAPLQAWMVAAAALAVVAGSARLARARAPAAAPALGLALAAFAGLALTTALGMLHSLRAPVLAAAALALAALLWRAGGEIADAEPSDEPLRRWHFAPLLLPWLAFAPAWLRAMAAPPRAWDALTYHLPRAVQWLQQGDFAAPPAPDAWRYYDFFAAGGDLWLAGGLLLAGGDAGLYLLYACSLAALQLGAYALARALGAARLPAALAAAWVCLQPCNLQLAATAYADPAGLAFALLSLALALRGGRDPQRRGALWGGAALAAAVAASLRWPSLLLLGATTALLLGQALASRRAAPLGVAALVWLPQFAWWGRAFVYAGSPLYPMGLQLGPLHWPGDALLADTLAARLPGMARAAPPWREVAQQLLGGPLNLGRSAGLVLAAALLAWGLGWRRREGDGAAYPDPGRLTAGSPQPALRRAELAGLAALALAALASLWPAEVVALRSDWLGVAGRHLALPTALAACVLAAQRRAGELGGRWPWGPLTLAAALAWAFGDAATPGLTALELRQSLALAPLGLAIAALAAAALALAIAAARGRGRRHPQVPRWRQGLHGRASGLLALACAAAAILLLGPLQQRRTASRQGFFEAVASGAAYELHPLQVDGQQAAWAYLQDLPPRRVAAVFDLRRAGQLIYRYPLYGAQLQHQLLYVSPASNGAPVALWPAPADGGVAARAAAAWDADRWADRLIAAGVREALISGAGLAEYQGVRARPDRFAPLLVERHWLLVRPLPAPGQASRR